MKTLLVLALMLVLLPRPAAADTCDVSWKPVVGILLAIDALTIGVNTVGLQQGKPNPVVGGLGILAGATTLALVSPLRDSCDAPGDATVVTMAVFGAATAVVGSLAIYRFARGTAMIRPVPIMGETVVAATFTVRF